MVKVLWTQKFEQDVKGVRHPVVKERVLKQIRKVSENPDIGKPLRYGLKGERTIYVKPYRLIYSVERDTLILLRFEHRKEVYE
ncbi:type II toxin-antitoxin system RelE/ParE family toxin [Candidatus Woesearchaeota archaeon]|nr:type II toxin-antitoxin system RelE/ParE family toxin [Candidatus Woesearchaeota archaeon]